MPTECERSATSLAQQHKEQQFVAQQQQQQQLEGETNEKDFHVKMEEKESNSEMSTSQTSTSSNGHNGIGKKVSITSPDPTAYVAKARVTRPTPPPPSYNPMQFVQIKPCNLYQTAQQQLKKAEEVKKIKEIKKEEPEDWQNNLDNWKSSRRKRVEHIIDRVVEVKKLELEEHDRSRRKSKTFSEMIEERGERGGVRGRTKLASLAVYNEDESNDLSDLGIGTSSASGKSSQSEDYDNNSVLSDNAELDKAIFESNHKPNSITREYISSPGYDTSSSTAPGSSPDPCEYTYEGAIQDYKQRVSRATSVTGTAGTGGIKLNSTMQKPTTLGPSKESTPERNGNGLTETYPTRRGSKIEDRLIGFEVTSPSDSQEGVEKNKVDVPKIDISKRKAAFENQNANEPKSVGNTGITSVPVPKVTLRDRFNASATPEKPESYDNTIKREVKRLSGDITSIRDRMQSLEQQHNLVNSSNGAATKLATAKSVDIPVPPLKDRLSSLQNAVTKEEVKKPPVALVDARQLEIMKNEEETAKQRIKQLAEDNVNDVTKTATDLSAVVSQTVVTIVEEAEQPTEAEVDRDDSGIHTSDDIEVEEHIVERLQKQQEEQLNAAIAALAMEEKQLEEAANAVNQIEAEFAEISSVATATMPALGTTTNEPPCDMEFSINEALELALEAIDKESQTQAATPNSNAHDEKTTNKNNNNNNNSNINININNNEITNQIDTPNKTDEEKELKSKLQTKLSGSTTNNHHSSTMPKCDTEDAPETAKIFEEPIYENISTASTAEVDAEARIIPNANTNNNNKNNHINHNHNNCSNSNASNNNSVVNKNNNCNNNNDNKTNDNSSHSVDLTNAFANTTTITAMAATTTTAATTATATVTGMVAHHNDHAMLTTKTTTTTIATMVVMSVEKQQQQQQQQQQQLLQTDEDPEPYYQVPKSCEPYYDSPKHLRPVPLYENIDIFYTGVDNSTLVAPSSAPFKLEPPKEKPPPPPTESPPLFDDVDSTTDAWSSDNTYETISSRRLPRQQNGLAGEHPSPPIKRMNSTKRIKKELRNKRSSFLGIEGSPDDEETYLELTVAPPPDMAQLLQEERRLEKQLYMKAGLCDSSDTGESRDSGVSENHSRQSSEHYTNSSEENDRRDIDTPPHSLKSNEMIYQNDALLTAAQTPLLQTVKGNSAESWTESATVAAAATKSLTEATATANAKMMSIEEKIREQEEVLRVERELLQLEQEELKRQRENLMLRENMARRELQHGAKMLMSANRRSLQDLNGVGVATMGLKIANGSGAGHFQSAAMPQTFAPHQQLPLTPQLLPQQQQPQQIYANVPNIQQQYYHQVETDYRKSMSDLNEFSKRLMLPPTPPTKPMRAMHIATTSVPVAATSVLPLTSNGHDEFAARQRHSLNSQSYGGSLVKIAATPTAAPRGGHIYSNYHHQSAQNLSSVPSGSNGAPNMHAAHHGNMTRNTLHALSATPKPKYTDGWVQVQNRKTLDTNLANDPAWLSAYQQKRKSMPDAYHAYNNHWLVQEAEQRRIAEQHRRSISTGNTPVHQQNGGASALKPTSASNSNGKPLPDSIIQTLTERVQSKGIGERKRFDNYNSNNNIDKSPLHAAAYRHHQVTSQSQQQQQQPHQQSIAAHRHVNHEPALPPQSSANTSPATAAAAAAAAAQQDKVLSVSGKKKCSHCGDELGRGAAMIIESLLLFYHINCFKCCVCHVQLGDGLNGTDVRVRNHKLHCQNCYSSDDGIKFSCV